MNLRDGEQTYVRELALACQQAERAYQQAQARLNRYVQVLHQDYDVSEATHDLAIPADPDEPVYFIKKDDS